MTSHGQRFRRRALRRGYKVDEVDAFLERVEATVAGEPLDAPVTAQEVRDVVFRVRLGGYDEWQVDLHLDRVERQLAEAVERTQAPAPFGAQAPDPYGGQAPDPYGGQAPDPYGGQAPDPYGGQAPEPYGAPAAAAPPPLPQRQAPAAGPPGDGGYGPYDQTYAGGGAGYGGYDADRFHSDMTTEMRMGEPAAPSRPPEPPAERTGPQPGLPVPGPAGHGGPHGAPPGGPGHPGPYGGAEHAGPHGAPGPGYGAPPAGPAQGAPPPHAGPPPGGPPHGGAPHGGPAMPPPGGAGPGMAGPAGPPGSPAGPPAGLPPEVQRVDQLRRSFQPRRFGSGYDRGQVDHLFEELLSGLSGRAPMAVTEAQLDPRQFDLVSGGYFEAEVDHALQEVREIMRRQ